MAVFPAPALILPRRFTSQPQGPVGIDYSNPVCRDLVFAVEGSQGTRDLVKPDFGSFKPTAPMPSGMAQVFGAASPSIYSARQDLAGATAATWQVLFKMSVLGAEIFEQWTGTQRWLVQTPGSIIWVAAQDNAGNRRRWDVTGTQFVVDYWYSLILSWRGGSDASVLLNGTFKTLSSVNAVATAIGTGLPAVRVGSITTTGGSVALARAWRRGLSESEMLSLHANPWQIFKPPSTVKTFLAAPRAPVSNKQSYPLATGSFTKTPSAPFLNVRRKTRTSQPQGPVGVDWGNPISQGLFASVVNTFDFVSMKKLASTTINSVVCPFGFAMQSDATTASFATIPKELSGAITVVSLVSRDASAVATTFKNLAPVATNKSAGQSTFWEFSLGNSFGAGGDIDKPRFSTNAAGIGSIYLDGVLQSGNNPSANPLTNGRFYVVAAVATSGASSSGSGVTQLHGEANSYTLNGRTAVTHLWNRALTSAEIVSISANPWQIFQPDNKPIYVEAP